MGRLVGDVGASRVHKETCAAWCVVQGRNGYYTRYYSIGLWRRNRNGEWNKFIMKSTACPNTLLRLDTPLASIARCCLNKCRDRSEGDASWQVAGATSFKGIWEWLEWMVTTHYYLLAMITHLVSICYLCNNLLYSYATDEWSHHFVGSHHHIDMQIEHHWLAPAMAYCRRRRLLFCWQSLLPAQFPSRIHFAQFNIHTWYDMDMIWMAKALIGKIWCSLGRFH